MLPLDARAAVPSPTEVSLEEAALDRLYEVPTDHWREVPEYEEEADGSRHPVSGFETTLRFPTRSFDVRLEKVSPDPRFASEPTTPSNFRLRVLGDTEDGQRVHTDFDIPRETQRRAEILHTGLKATVLIPRERRRNIAEHELRTDFESEVRRTSSA